METESVSHGQELHTALLAGYIVGLGSILELLFSFKTSIQYPALNNLPITVQFNHHNAFICHQKSFNHGV